jgi:long-chain acyl-CoA synthetase
MTDIDTTNTVRLIRQAHCFDEHDADTMLVDWPSLGALLASRGRDQHDQIFMRYFDDESNQQAHYTYRKFDALVARIATWLVNDFGIKPGQAVATLAYNHPLAAATLFACWRIGAIAAPQNLHESDEHIAYTLQDSSCAVLLALADCADRAKGIVDLCNSLIPVATLHDPADIDPLANDAADFRHSPALIVYTSGTTGSPKGVVLTQYNLLINALGTTQVHEVDSATTLMCVLPIHHVNGIVVTLVATVLAGARVVLNRGFRVSTFWSRMATEGVGIVSVVPTILQFLCEADEDIRPLNIAKFRHFICGAGTLAIALVERFETRFGFPVIHGYGLSETTAFACSMPLHMPAPVRVSPSKKARQYWLSGHGYPSIGAAFPHCEVAIHDAEGVAQTEGLRGEIVVRGHYIMSGYHRRPDANAETFKHGWFRSGDEGFFKNAYDGRAYFFITGRIKELINRGGVKYSPFEIEEVLLEIQGVKVGLAIAFDNDWYGEEVGAYVVRAVGSIVTAEEILKHCAMKLPFAKRPKVVVFGDEIPVTVTGKYQRLRLKPLFIQFQSTQFRPY